jgi:hypothetical protein
MEREKRLRAKLRERLHLMKLDLLLRELEKLLKKNLKIKLLNSLFIKILTLGDL